MSIARRLPIGAEPGPEGVSFRVWAPRARHVDVDVDGLRAPLRAAADGYHEAEVPGVAAGARYGFSLDDGPLLPDPASRYQPDGTAGLSVVVDPASFAWSDRDWRGVRREHIVLYELHVGTFTEAGTFAGAVERLPFLAELGITMVEVMPVAEFAGRFNWGYDGVMPFTPTHRYGTPDDFRRFVDRAHALGVGVILDVVYNHLGPSGNCLPAFGPYLSERHVTEWGQGLNYDGEDCGPVREYIRTNAAYWIAEFHLDGLRLDATQGIFDDSDVHIVTELALAARAAAGDRELFIVAENEPEDVWHLRPRSEGGAELDAMWNDDFHHTAMVALLGRREAYMRDYGGTPQEFASCLRHGFLYQGQLYAWHGKPRGTPSLGIDPRRYVVFIQNHDQVANTGFGKRIHMSASPATLRAVTALLLLGPNLPMLFQGQEFQASAIFTFFADHEEPLATQTHQGRRGFVAQFPSLATADSQALIPAPHGEGLFESCRLDWSEVESNAHVVALHRDLLALRRGDPVLSAPTVRLETAVLGPETMLARWIAPGLGDRLLILNLHTGLILTSQPEPLLAPPAGAAWEVVWSSEWARYGALGQPEVFTPDVLVLPARSAVLCAARS